MGFFRKKFVVILLALMFAVPGCRRAEADPPQANSPTPTIGPAIATPTTAPEPERLRTTPATLHPATPTQPPPTATPSPTIEVTDWHEALAFQRHGDYERAVRAYQALLARRPSDADARAIRFHLGESYLLNDQPVAAARVLSDYVIDYPDNAMAWFLLGRAGQATEDWADAREAFLAYRRLDDTLADYAGLYIAQALERLDRTDEAIKEYEAIVQITADDELAVKALEGLAEIALAQNDLPTAAERYVQAAGRAPEPAEKARLLGLAGTSYLAAGRQAEAVRVLQQVVEEYTNTGSAYMALGELLLLEESVSQRTRGLVYYHNGDYRAAVDALTQYLVSEAAPLGDTLYFLGRSYDGLGRWASAINAYEQLIKNYPGNEHYGAAWMRKARAQRRLGRTNEAIATFREFARAHPGDPLADNALWEAARALEGLGRRAEAAEIYRVIVDRYPQGDVGAEAGFRVGILPYLDGDYTTAREAWHRAADQANRAEARARALLWAGKAALAQGDTEAATKDLITAARIAPLSFDGLRARELLVELTAETPELPAMEPPSLSAWLRVSDGTLTEIDRLLQSDRRYRRGQALLAVGLRDEGLGELKALRDAYWRLPAHLARLAMLLDDPGSRHPSIASAERALILMGTSPLAAPPEIARLAYPVDYPELLRGESRRYGLDARLLAALIRQESRFNPTAISYASARGLTQVIPSTAWYIADKLGVQNFDVETLYRPYRSIQFGAWYLAEQMERFGDTILALAAYNGGPGNSRRWQRLTDDVDMLVASIHLDQTQKYVRLVVEQYEIYKALYDKQLAVKGGQASTDENID